MPVETQPDTASIGYQRIDSGLKAQWVSRQFDAIAERYDLLNTLLSLGIHYAWKRSTIRSVRFGAGDRILDLCGGTGDLAGMSRRRLSPGGTPVLCDINYKMMQVGRQTVPAETDVPEAIRYVQGDAERLPFRDRSFDAVVIGFGVRNLTRLESGFSEIYRILKPGGEMACLEFSTPPSRLLKKLYDIYSFTMIPLLGRVVSGSQDAYRYLPESIRVFPLPDALAEMLAAIGFQQVGYRALTGGIACIHHAQKPA